MELTKETLNRLLEVGNQLQAPRIHDGIEPFVVTMTGEIKSLKALRPPQRIEQRLTMVDAGSFCEYVNLFKMPQTQVFASVTPTGARLTAVLDYHVCPMRPSPDTIGEDGPKVPDADYNDAAVADYCDHRVTLELVQTADWMRWIGANRKPMNQVEFATWLEDNQHLFNAVPENTLSGAQLLELVSTMHGISNVGFTSMHRLKDGANRLTYVQDDEVKGELDGKPVVLPGMVEAALQPFEGSEFYQVSARLKTRVEGRKLSIWFETVQLEKIIRDAVLDAVKLVATKTGIIPLIGSL